VQYLGIAADEPERIERHINRPNIILPLVDIGWDEEMCRKICEENDLLSPVYTTSARDGCWFCHNQGVEQLRLLRKNYPHLWKLLLQWDKDSPVSFKPDGHTVHDFDLRFDMEDRGLIDPTKRFYWKYIKENEMAKKVNPTETQTVETSKLSIYEKLAKIKSEILETGIGKSGINSHAEFDYFELFDIIPIVDSICSKYRALYLATFPEGKAVGRLIDLDDPIHEITIEFSSTNIAEPGKFRMNEVQALGASLTYMRRYLYLVMFDIIDKEKYDADSLPSKTNEDVSESKKPTIPKTAEERKDIKETLTATTSNADEMQINALKAALIKLREIDETKEEFIQQIAIKTEGFTKISKENCETLILGISEMIENYNLEE